MLDISIKLKPVGVVFITIDIIIYRYHLFPLVVKYKDYTDIYQETKIAKTHKKTYY